jgi:hypothetical protein
MKKLVISIIALAVVAVALGTAGFVYAQTPGPQQTPVPGIGYGYGRMGGRGMRGGMMGAGAAGVQSGFLHDEMVTAFAQKLGVSVDDLNARLAKGETMAQIASSKGLSADQFTTMMTEARTQALDQAVKDGKITQAQADWMKQRGGMMGGRGAGMGRFANPDCPYDNQTNP